MKWLTATPRWRCYIQIESEEIIMVEEETRVVERPGVTGPVIAQRVVYYIFGLIEAIILLRFILLLLAANRGNAFVDFIYDLSNIFVAPFYGIFNYTPVYGQSVFDVSSLVAIVVYGLIAWALASLFTLGSRRREVEA